ncbi:MAG: GIY-YIG nuclease family protein [Candidatus Omnitrophota bacterium]|jgi:putative endonuclease
MFWYVYIIACKDTKLYTGITNDLKRRLKEHNQGKGCKFTRVRKPVKLMYSELLPDLSAALKREAAIKRLKRERKLELFS